MIKLKSINKQFHTKSNTVSALSDVSFEIHDEEVFGIVGKSGVGKSTLLKILSLQIKPDSGNLNVLGIDVAELSSHDTASIIKETSFIYQGFSLLYNKSVLDNIALPLQLRGISKEIRHNMAVEMLKFVGLENKAYDFPITLSGGEAQRVAIARSLVTNPKILFLDEPTSSLDTETTLEILNLLKRIHETFKPTMIIVTHQLDIIRYICDRVVLLESGKVKRIGKVAKLDLFESNQIDTLWGDSNE